MKEERISEHVSHPFGPIYDKSSRVIILGSMPSPKSREVGFYYGHPQNRFWRVLSSLWDEPVPSTNEEREALLHCHGIALWDVIGECEISGASDSSIKNEKANDIAYLARKTEARAVFMTGKTAYKLYEKYCAASVGLPYFALPSTSAANAAASLDMLTESYRAILNYTDLQYKQP